MDNDEKIPGDDDNWLHEQWIICPACHESLFRIDQSPLDNSNHFYCDHCPVRIDVNPYGPEYERIVQSLAPLHDDDEQQYADYRAALMRVIETHLKPCMCGGTFRHDAPRRCFSCSAPVITEGADGVDLYLNDDGYSQDIQRLQRFEVWSARFCPDRADEDKWKHPPDTTLGAKPVI